MADFYETRRLIKYSILQTTTIPSLCCDLMIFIYFIRHFRKEFLKSPYNHVVFCLFAVSFIQKTIDTPALLYYLRWGTVPIQHDTFCLAWNWLDYSINGTCLHLLTWCCIERHLFIFHGTMMQKHPFLICFHYIPMFISLIYMSVFYAVVMLFQTGCTNTWYYSLAWCGVPCYMTFIDLSTFEWLFHCVFPNVLIIIFNAGLFGRVIWQKIKQQRPIRWRRQRKLIVQLIFISGLYLVFYFPMVVVGLIQTLWQRDFLAEIQFEYFYFIIYFVTQFLPFVIAGQLPGFRQEWMIWFQRLIQPCQTRTQIVPSALVTPIVLNEGMHRI